MFIHLTMVQIMFIQTDFVMLFQHHLFMAFRGSPLLQLQYIFYLLLFPNSYNHGYIRDFISIIQCPMSTIMPPKYTINPLVRRAWKLEQCFVFPDSINNAILAYQILGENNAHALFKLMPVINVSDIVKEFVMEKTQTCFNRNGALSKMLRLLQFLSSQFWSHYSFIRQDGTMVVYDYE